MKVAAMLGEGKGGLVEKPDPKAKGEFVVVKIHVTPMCTEYHGFKRGSKSDNLGHEAAGEVVEVAQPGKVEVGDRVVVMPQYPCGKCPLCLAGEYIHCQHNLNVEEVTGNVSATATYAQYMVKQDWLLVPIPDDISYEHASMACCGLGPTFNATQLMNVNSFDTVLITGMGPVGLGGVINCVHRGARVIAVEMHPYRANLAKELGAEVAIDPSDEDALDQIMDLTDGVGVDKAIDCSASAEGARLLIDAARRKGHVSFVGAVGELTVRPSRDMVGKGLTLHGAWHFNLGDSPRIMEVVKNEPDLLNKLITHTFPMSKVQEAWELQVTGNCGKVVLYPWE
ncbi:zinc-binding dehydrogenase [Candidatus Poribacteria bacterium]